jgi:acylphosphatase
MAQVAARWLVSGRVQGVGFRWFVVLRAQGANVRGWVRNLPDGRVEVVAAGNQAALDALEKWLQIGPRSASVTAVEKTDISHESIVGKTFIIK